MDPFGIGAAVMGAARIYFASARRTGRTTALIESITSGDRIVFTDQREADRVRRLCLDRGLNVDCITLEPSRPDPVSALRKHPHGRTVFDHSWIEQYYEARLKQGQEYIDYLQRELSEHYAPAVETKLQAEEIDKWRV